MMEQEVKKGMKRRCGLVDLAVSVQLDGRPWLIVNLTCHANLNPEPFCRAQLSWAQVVEQLMVIHHKASFVPTLFEMRYSHVNSTIQCTLPIATDETWTELAKDSRAASSCQMTRLHELCLFDCDRLVGQGILPIL
jgi:hypothetical protein